MSLKCCPFCNNITAHSYPSLIIIGSNILWYSLAIRDYWSIGKEDQKDDKYVVLVSFDVQMSMSRANRRTSSDISFVLLSIINIVTQSIPRSSMSLEGRVMS